ncbi:lipocalin family protein [uncultured Winogradskyella sp.]|uniref:lipocalin family protein n=1 Tax=Winogradskyella sp. 4-2091 TaxID=3381659 RepID=UPI002627C8A7|nr:lipocalin family protein [uncultured Winogradskyella sp.]
MIEKNPTVVTKQYRVENFRNLINIRTSILILLSLLVFSCSKNPESYIEHIEGYWEIQVATLADGSKKEYKFNETIDYLSVNDSLKGFRKKLKPGINDTYFTSGDAENIELKIDGNKLIILYATPYAKWSETVLNADKKELRIMNDDEDIYLYKRYESIKLDLQD